MYLLFDNLQCTIWLLIQQMLYNYCYATNVAQRYCLFMNPPNKQYNYLKIATSM